MRRLSALVVAGCTAAACSGDGGDTGPSFDFTRDTVAEECAANTGIVGLATEWTYGASAELQAENLDVDETIRVTNVNGRDIEAQSLRTVKPATGGSGGDSGGDSGTGDSGGDTEGTIEHFTWTMRCEDDGLYLLAEARETYASTVMTAGPELSGTRTLDAPVLVTPATLALGTTWTESWAGTSTYPGDPSPFAYTRDCTVVAAQPVDFAVGTLDALEVRCTSSDAAHDETYWQVVSLGRARDATREILAYVP